MNQTKPRASTRSKNGHSDFVESLRIYQKPPKEAEDNPDENGSYKKPSPDPEQNGKPVSFKREKPASRSAERHLAGIVKREKTRHMEMLSASLFQQIPFNERRFMWISRIGPDELVENRPAWVEFTIWNMGDALTDAFVRARISPRQSIDEYAASFEFPVKSLAHGQTMEGAMSFKLPRADTDNVITIELCTFGDIPPGGEFPPINVIATDQSIFDVAAKFSVHMQGIWIRETASHHNDTLFVALNGQYENQSWADTTSLGDHNNTSSRSGIPVPILPVGPFNMIPGRGKSFAFSCVIANAGHTSSEEDAKKALKVVSATGAVVATTVMSIIFPFGAAVWAGLSAGINEMHQAIIDWALADCDTVVLSEGRLVNEQDLFLYTSDPNDSLTEAFPPNWVIRSRKKAGEMLENVLGGGCRDSDYTATFSLERHRPPEMQHDYSADGMLLSPNQVVSFGVVTPGNAPVLYEIEGGGKVQTNGLFKAPASSTERKFTIVKWTTFEENKNGVFPNTEDFAIVLLD